MSMDTDDEQGSGCVPESPLLAICTDLTRCGGAVYSNSRIELVADRRDSADPYKGLDILIQKVNPDKVIVSSVQRKLILFLEKRFHFDVHDISSSFYRRNVNPNQSASANPKTQTQSSTQPDNANSSTQDVMMDLGGIVRESAFTLIIVPNYWFSMTNGYQKLLDSELATRRGCNSDEDRSLFIASKVEKSVDVCAIRAISALDSYIHMTSGVRRSVASNRIDSRRTDNCRQSQFSTQHTEQPVETNPINMMPILDVKYIDPGPVLSMDKFTFESLAVFHGLQNKSNGQSDGDLNDHDPDVIPSLYELLNQCYSPQGRRQLHTIMLWPLQDVIELKHRHDAIDFFSEPENKLLIDQIKVSLKNVIPLSRILINLTQSIATYKDFAALYKVIWAFISIIDSIKAYEYQGVEIFNRIINMDSEELRQTAQSILNIVDFDASRGENHVQVCVGVDQSVDEKKEIVKNLAKLCHDMGIQETTRYKNILAKMCRVIYIPRIGFLNSVDYNSTSELLEIRANPEFEVLLHTEQSVYFKTPCMEELDRNAGDIACDLIDVQQTVLMQLQNSLLGVSSTLLALVELCGEMDCLIAFAEVSSHRGYIRPEFIESNEEFDIHQAYHPLHCTTSNMVPNDIKFYKEGAGRRAKVMIITGPNACGKTTYMKTACLIVYMAQIGCFVPASYAKLPIVDAILTRMNPANSVSTGLSSFATDLHQINYALNRATDRSLIAIDEFGKGTQARDGFHLLKGLIMYFAIRALDSPYVMATSHFNQLVDHLQSLSEYIIYKTFKVSRNILRDSIVYEYEAMDGVGELTLADEVAMRAGVPQFIIERAKQMRDYISESRAIGPRAPHAA